LQSFARGGSFGVQEKLGFSAQKDTLVLLVPEFSPKPVSVQCCTPPVKDRVENSVHFIFILFFFFS